MGSVLEVNLWLGRLAVATYGEAVKNACCQQGVAEQLASNRGDHHDAYHIRGVRDQHAGCRIAYVIDGPEIDEASGSGGHASEDQSDQAIVAPAGQHEDYLGSH